MKTLTRPQNSHRRSKAPKYQQFAEQLRQLMEQERLRPGDRLPTLAKLREQFGTTNGTMEKVYSVLEQEGRIVREQGRGTFVAQPRLQTKGVIGFVGGVSNQHHFLYWVQLLAGVQEAAARAGVEVMLLDPDGPAPWEKIDAVISCARWIEPILDRLPPQMTSVSILTPVVAGNGVMADDFGGAKSLTKHLLALGHKRIAYLAGYYDPWYDPYTERRVAGYKSALLEAAIDPEPGWTHLLNTNLKGKGPSSGVSYEELGYHSMLAWLDAEWSELGCTALLTQNDRTALGVIQALKERGLRVPQDVSVVGFDGCESFPYFQPQLTTVEVPLRQVGAAGVEMLLRHLQHPAKKIESLVVPTVLRVGGSTQPPKGGPNY